MEQICSKEGFAVDESYAVSVLSVQHCAVSVLKGRLASSCAPGYYSHEQQQREVHKQQ